MHIALFFFKFNRFGMLFTAFALNQNVIKVDYCEIYVIQ